MHEYVCFFFFLIWYKQHSTLTWPLPVLLYSMAPFPHYPDHAITKLVLIHLLAFSSDHALTHNGWTKNYLNEVSTSRQMNTKKSTRSCSSNSYSATGSFECFLPVTPASLLWGWKPARTQLLPQDRTFRKHSQRKSLNSPHTTRESQERQHQVSHAKCSQSKAIARWGYAGSSRQRNNHDCTHPSCRINARRKIKTKHRFCFQFLKRKLMKKVISDTIFRKVNSPKEE